MKNKASAFLKQLFSTVVAVVKAKSTAVRAKTSAMKTRLLIFGILRNKKLLMSAINHKIHAVMGKDGNNKKRDHDGGDNDVHVDNKKAVVLYSAPSFTTERAAEEEDDGNDEYLTHSLFDMEDEEDELVTAPAGSVIDLVRNHKEGGGAEFRLEDEIDHVADVFIKRFHREMKLQKLESFKRFCEMLERSP